MAWLKLLLSLAAVLAVTAEVDDTRTLRGYGDYNQQDKCKRPQRGDAQIKILGSDASIAGKTVTEWGNIWQQYVFGTDEDELAFRLDRAAAEANIKTPTKPVLLLGGLVCTQEEAVANPEICGGQVPNKITRKATISLKYYQYVYVPIVNESYICFPEETEQECATAKQAVCFSEPDAFDDALAAGDLPASVNGCPVSKRILEDNADDYQIKFVAEDNILGAQPEITPGKQRPPLRACQHAVAFAIKLLSPGKLTIQFAAENVGGVFNVGPIKYELNIVH